MTQAITGGVVNDNYNYQTPATGATVTLANSDWKVVINPTATLGSLTIKMCPTPHDGQTITVEFTKAISALTVSPNSGQSVNGTTFVISANQALEAIYRSATTTWYVATATSRVRLLADANFYIATTGSDSTGDGSVGNPWRQPVTWFNYTVSNLDLGGFNSICNIADGSYEGIQSLGLPLGSGNLVLLGNNTTPANVIFTAALGGSGVSSLFLEGPFNMWVSGITFNPGSNKTAIDCDVSTAVFLGEPTFTQPSKCIFKNTVICGQFFDNSLDVSVIAGASITSFRSMFATFALIPCQSSIYAPDFQITGALNTGNTFYTLQATGGTWQHNGAIGFAGGASFTGNKVGLAYECQLGAITGLGNVPGTTPDYFLGSGHIFENVITDTYYGGFIAAGDQRESRTTNLTLPAFVNSAGGGVYRRNNMQFDNSGASGTVIITLPTILSAFVGYKFGFNVVAAQILEVLAPASTTITLGATISAAAGNIQSSTIGSYVELEAVSTTKWVAKTVNGTWSVT